MKIFSCFLNLLVDILNEALRYKEIKDILHSLSITTHDAKMSNFTMETFWEDGNHELEWFYTFYYPTQRFVVKLPDYQNSIIDSITMRTKLNVS